MEYLWMFIIGTIVTLIIIYLAYQAGAKNRATNTSSSPSSSPVRKIPVIRTPQYPTVYAAYQKHYPNIKSALFKALEEADYFDYVDRQSVDAEIRCFMCFLAMSLSDKTQYDDGDYFIDSILEVMDKEDMNYRIDIYSQIWVGSLTPRCDWGRPVSKHNIIFHEMPAVRVIAAFGDFVVNPSCSQDYEDAPPLSGSQSFFLFGFDNHFENEIFEKIADYTQCFPTQIRYQK